MSPFEARTAPAATTAATARITAEPDGRGGTDLPVLAGGGPIALRRTRGTHPARVVIVGSMAAPIGGDHLALRAEVRPGAALEVGSAAATVSLPSADRRPARYDLDLAVGENAELHWLPEPVIAAAGSHLITTTRIDLAETARLRYREEQVLGRHHDWARGAGTGRITARLTVRRGGRLLLDQQTDLGPGAPGWDGPAVLGGRRACGQLLVVGVGAGEAGEVETGEGEESLMELAEAEAGAAVRVAVGVDAGVVRRLLGF
ncbi:urease accessory protein UreD [Kitasatospora camelliae]|uniref:Urease accessory protein UreD n=1 Tax=Kitasatospora camelliae TaxID=3156397 RepID=A0AAU8JQQ2_9ACTN